MLLESHRYSVMCITQDGLALSPEDQAERLCEAGARWIQLRMKNADHGLWLATAKAVVAVCREHGAVCIINDSVDIAIAAAADGVHLGKADENWRAARQRLGRSMLLGGTINNEADAKRAITAGCLDYVGVGPWRHTTTKQNLAPVLGPAGVRLLVAMVDGLPAWAIGGITPADLPDVRATGAAGVAVASGLSKGGRIEGNFKTYAAAWAGEAV
jgi:thiamine-phosphate pyrophosphorylase